MSYSTSVISEKVLHRLGVQSAGNQHTTMMELSSTFPLVIQDPKYRHNISGYRDLIANTLADEIMARKMDQTFAGRIIGIESSVNVKDLKLRYHLVLA